MPFNKYGAKRNLETVYKERERDISVVSQLENGKLNGRVRNTGATARAIPTASTDILQGDAEGDVLYDTDYLYLCLNINDTLTWCYVELASSW